MSGKIVGIFISAGGVPKRPVLHTRVASSGLIGDAVRHGKIHGGPERAVCLFSTEVMHMLQAEDHPIQPGMIGENILIAELPWDGMIPGTRLALGSTVVLEVASYAAPCRQIAAAFSQGDFRRVMQDRFPGCSRLYARVLGEGDIAIGDAVRLA